MIETLSEKQARFTEMIGRLIAFAYKNDYRLTFGDAYRDPRLFGMHGEKKGYGRRLSNHKIRLAVDFNLFKKDINGKYQYCSSTTAHQPLGEYWESIGS
jgi:hypothetical protein